MCASLSIVDFWIPIVFWVSSLSCLSDLPAAEYGDELVPQLLRSSWMVMTRRLDALEQGHDRPAGYCLVEACVGHEYVKSNATVHAMLPPRRLPTASKYHKVLRGMIVYHTALSVANRPAERRCV